MILNTVMIGIFLVYFITRRFPDEFERFLIVFSYNSIYFYSKVQILISQTKTSVNKFIDSNKYLSKIKNNISDFLSIYHSKNKIMIEVVYNDGEVSEKISSENDFFNPDNKLIDFYIYKYNNKDGNCMTKRIFHKGNEFKQINLEESDIKFILVELKIGENNIYKIELKTHGYNFYLVGNEFKKSFFIYYLRHILKINKEDLQDLENLKFSVKIIDNDVNIVEFDFTDQNESILLEKTIYQMKKNDIAE